MLTKAEVREVVARDLGVSPATIGDDDDLVNFGMNSIRLMQLVGKWRKQGYDVRSASFVLKPTIAAWAELLGESSSTAAVPSAGSSTSQDLPESDEFALATMQHAYWLGRRHDQRLGGVAAHLYAEFDGHGLHAERLRRAVDRLIRRHEMLRAQILDSGTQRILDQPSVPVFGVTDLSSVTDNGRLDAELDRIRHDKSHQRMDIAAGQVVDVWLTVLPGGRHRLHLDVDMVAADAQSYRRILDDLATLYEADSDSLEPIGVTFREYLASKAGVTRERAADARWWSAKIPDMPQVPPLVTIPEKDRADPSRSVRLHHWIDTAAKARLYEAAYGNGITPAVVLATVFSEVIARWSGQQRFMLNLPLFNREPLHDDIHSVVGDFTNSVLLDVDMRQMGSIVASAKRLQRELHTCLAHSGYEGLDVLREMGRIHGAPVTPSVVFTSGLDLGELFSERVTDLLGDPVWILSQGPQVDLDAQVAELNGGLLVNWDLRKDSMPVGVAEAMFAQFRRTLDALTTPGADWTVPLDIWLPEDQLQARATANETTVALGARTLHGAFFELAQTNPEAVALQTLNTQVSYRELADQALAIAQSLTKAGLHQGDTVAVLVNKGPWQVAAVLGVLAAGGSYLPIAIDQPAARRDRILQRGNVSVALVDNLDRLPETVAAVQIAEAIAGPRAESECLVDPDAIAYVLFTSGSTGDPKGVEVSHRAAANTIDAIADRFGFSHTDRTIALSALTFDLSVYDIFAPLSRGGALVCVDATAERDADAWARLIDHAGVTVLNCAPGLITMLVDTASPGQLSTLRLVLTGGDRVKGALAQRIRSLVPGLRFVGLGGATETAIHSTVCEVGDDFPAHWDNVPYGVPLANVQLRVVNERGEDCPDWVAGELWIGGTSVADGYRNDPDRTADRFLVVEGVSWYRTGDRARYLPGGIVDFLGRADHQVKIRGYRVELGEVESALASIPGVDEAVALVTDSGRLVAAVRARGDVDASDISKELRDLLPSYMIPDLIDILTELPLTPNGKVNRAEIRRGLKTDDLAATSSAYIEPSDDVEAAIEFIAAQVLGLEQIGVETDFYDAGGNSILATTLTGQIRGLLAVPGFGVTAVMEGRTARKIAANLRNADDPQRLERACAILLELAGIKAPAVAGV